MFFHPSFLKDTKQESMNNTQFSIFLFHHSHANTLLLKCMSTYSLSGCHQPGLTLGPLLGSGGGISTTTGDGGGTSTTSGDECTKMTSSSLQKQK